MSEAARILRKLDDSSTPHSPKVLMNRSLLLAAIASAVALSACGSIIHGSSQDIGISSTPTSASVSIDNVTKGQTPIVAKLSRKDNHIIHIAADGYQPADLTLTRSVSGW